MGKIPAHHAGVRCHRDHLRYARPGKDAFIGAVAPPVAGLQVLLGGVEGVGILHSEFPDTDQAGPGPRFIPEFGLDLIKKKGIAAVGGAVFPHQRNSGLLVGHAQHHRRTVPVRKTQQLAANGVITAGFLPIRGGQHYGKLDLLAICGIHFLPDDPFDFPGDPAQGRQGGIDAVCHVFHVAAAQHEGVALHDTIGGRFPEPVAD